MGTIDRLFAKFYPDAHQEQMHYAEFFAGFLFSCWVGDDYPYDLLRPAIEAAGIDLPEDSIPYDYRLINNPNLVALREESGGRVHHPHEAGELRAAKFEDAVREFYGGNTRLALVDALKCLDDDDSVFNSLMSGERVFSKVLAGGRGGSIYADEFYTYDEIVGIAGGDAEWADRFFEKIGRTKDALISGSEIMQNVERVRPSDEEE